MMHGGQGGFGFLITDPRRGCSKAAATSAKAPCELRGVSEDFKSEKSQWE